VQSPSRRRAIRVSVHAWTARDPLSLDVGLGRSGAPAPPAPAVITSISDVIAAGRTERNLPRGAPQIAWQLPIAAAGAGAPWRPGSSWSVAGEGAVVTGTRGPRALARAQMPRSPIKGPAFGSVAMPEVRSPMPWKRTQAPMARAIPTAIAKRCGAPGMSDQSPTATSMPTSATVTGRPSIRERLESMDWTHEGAPMRAIAAVWPSAFALRLPPATWRAAAPSHSALQLASASFEGGAVRSRLGQAAAARSA
jgi:hypothetical protein